MKVSQEAEDRLQQLAEGGKLNPENVVREAEADKTSPLRDYFTWNNKLAAHKYRLEEARALIRSVKIEVTHNEVVVTIPKYVHDPGLNDEGDEDEDAKPGRKQGYIETLSAENDLELARQIVKAELTQALSHLRRANRVAEALGISDEIGGMIATGAAIFERI